MKETLLLEIDLSSRKCKITIINPKVDIVGEASAENETLHPRTFWCEQNPFNWF